jgi:hypothetical protein
VRLLARIRALPRGGESLIVLALLTTAMLLSPPRLAALSVCIVIALVVTLAGAASHAIRKAEAVGGHRSGLNSLARATTALSVSASILMILGATLAAIG